MYLNDSDIPITVRMASDRFSQTLFANTNVFSKGGIDVNGVNVSLYNAVKSKKIYKIINNLRASSGNDYNLFHIISRDNRKTDTEVAEKFKNGYLTQELHLYVFTCNDFDVVIPGIIVADSNGDPYFLYSTNAGALSTAIVTDATTLAIEPVSHALYSSLRKKITKDPLTEALSHVSNYILYSLSHVEQYREFFGNLFKRIGLDDLHMNMYGLLNKFIYLPVVDLTTDIDGKLQISKALIHEAMKLKYKEYNGDNAVVILYENDKYPRSITINTLPNIVVVNGRLSALDVTNLDINPSGESFKLETKEVIKHEKDPYVTVVGNLRYVENTTPLAESFEETLKYKVNSVKNKITDTAKKDAELEVLNYYTDNIITRGEGVGAESILRSANALKYLASKMNYVSKATIKTNIANALSAKAESLYKSGQYSALINLNDYKHLIDPVFKGV